MTIGLIIIIGIACIMLLAAVGKHRQMALDQFRRDAVNGYVVGFYHGGEWYVGEVIASAVDYVVIRIESGATFKRYRTEIYLPC